MQFELDNLFRSKCKRIFELDPSTPIKLVDRQNTSSISLPVFRKKLSRNTMKKKAQLAINLGLKTLQIVQFVMSNNSIYIAAYSCSSI